MENKKVEYLKKRLNAVEKEISSLESEITPSAMKNLNTMILIIRKSLEEENEGMEIFIAILEDYVISTRRIKIGEK